MGIILQIFSSSCSSVTPHAGPHVPFSQTGAKNMWHKMSTWARGWTVWISLVKGRCDLQPTIYKPNRRINDQLHVTKISHEGLRLRSGCNSYLQVQFRFFCSCSCSNCNLKTNIRLQCEKSTAPKRHAFAEEDAMSHLSSAYIWSRRDQPPVQNSDIAASQWCKSQTKCNMTVQTEVTM